MLYDNGGITQQVAMNEKNAQAAEELRQLKENARLKAEAKNRENLALQAKDLGRQEVLSQIEDKLTKNFEIQQMADREALANSAGGLFDYFVGDMKGSQKTQQAATEQADYEREQVLKNQRPLNVDSDVVSKEDFKRYERIFDKTKLGSNNIPVTEEEINNAYSLIKNNKNFTDEEIRKMALNRN